MEILTKERIEQIEINERLIKVAQALKGRKEKLSEEEYQIVKLIFHNSTELDFIPKSLWISLAQMLVLKEVSKGEKLIAKINQDPPCCIILSGEFLISVHEGVQNNKSDEKILVPGNTCGNFPYFLEKHWKPMDIIALDDNCSAAIFNPKELGKLLEIENSNVHFKSLLEYLSKSIPGFEQLSGHYRERLCRFFKEVVFLANRELIKEFTVPSHAYLIKEGTCIILSRQNPLNHNSSKVKSNVGIRREEAPITYSVKRIVNRGLSPAKTLRGTMSLSTNLYQLRIVNKMEWLGEECLLLNEIPNIKYEYSAIATTKVVALQISHENLKKFPIEILNWFKENAQNKIKWHEERKDRLANAVKKIYKKDSMIDFLDEALQQVNKRFPQATPRLKLEIYKHNFVREIEKNEISVESDSNRLITKKNTLNKSKLLSDFDNLRSIMNTKRQIMENRTRKTNLRKVKSVMDFNQDYICRKLSKSNCSNTSKYLLKSSQSKRSDSKSKMFLYPHRYITPFGSHHVTSSKVS